MSTYQRAQALIKQGFWIFPSQNKAIHITDWPNAATRDPEQIKNWFGPGGTHETWGVSTLTGKFGGDNEALVAADVDPRNGGLETVKAILKENPTAFPDTRQHSTPSGGVHLLYRMPHPGLTSKTHALGAGVDVKSAGGLIHFGPAYQLAEDAPVALVPTWIIVKCTQAKDTKPIEKLVPVEIDQTRAEQRAVQYLVKEAPLAIEGLGGDETTYKTAARCKDFGLSEDRTLALMSEVWDPRCMPPWGPDLAAKVSNAYGYGTEPIGVLAPESQFTVVPTEPPKPWVIEMNTRRCVVNQGGEMVIYTNAHDDALGRDYFETSSFEDLRRMYSNKIVEAIDPKTKKKIYMDQGSAWLSSPDRRQYLGGVRYSPGQDTPPDVLNLWKGFSVTPKPGSWARMRNHLYEVICDRNDAAFAYLMNWLARLMQSPGEQGQVAIVLRGGRGTGKGVFGNALLKIFGSHGLHITNPELFIGRFNAHLRGTSFLFVDEAIYAPNRQHEAALKALITEPLIQIEAKFQTPIMVKNTSHAVIASNDDWVVGAGPDERRYSVSDVSDRYQQNAAYFTPLWREMETGGLSAMLYDLLAHSLAGFDVNAVPNTDALASQKLSSLRGTDAWIFACLQHEAIASHQWGQDGCELSKSEAYDSYVITGKRVREYAPADVRTWGRMLRKALPRCVGECRRGSGRGDEQRSRNLLFSGLAECRKAFESYIRQPIRWEAEDAQRVTYADLFE
jgi:hypothetical protein